MITIMISILSLSLGLGRDKYTRFGFDTVGLVLGSILGAAVGVMLAFLIGGTASPVAEITEHPVRAVVDTTSTSGKFFILAGSVDEDLVYRFYTMEENGDIIFRELDAEDVVIREQDDASATLVISDENPDMVLNHYPTWYQLLALPGLNDPNPTFQLIVPPGAIVSGVDLDLR